MFVTSDVTLDLGIAAARARLVHLLRDGGLAISAAAAYDGEVEQVIRVGPLGDLPGISKLVRVRFLDPVYRGDAMTLGMRWEATGPAGGLFPVLDADLSLEEAGPQRTRLALVGSYRPPLGRLGSGLDRVVLNRTANATLHSLLLRVAGALVEAAPQALADPARDRPLLPLIEPDGT